jgi:hypothetical protein
MPLNGTARGVTAGGQFLIGRAEQPSLLVRPHDPHNRLPARCVCQGADLPGGTAEVCLPLRLQIDEGVLVRLPGYDSLKGPQRPSFDLDPISSAASGADSIRHPPPSVVYAVNSAQPSFGTR